jgi:peptidoglycan/xylan/chitin deacetylase (PgdA/CDA1 family)
MRQESDANRKTIYLTIDDVPSKRGTRLILDALAECRVKATMFVIGENALANTNALLAVVNGGHSLANHDLSNRLSCSVPTKALTNDLVETRRIIASFGSEVPYFRPGSALFTTSLLSVAKDLGYTTVLGDVYAHDGLLGFISPRLVACHAKWRVRPGSIIVLHDGSEFIASHTAAVIREIVPHFQLLGYTFHLLK